MANILKCVSLPIVFLLVFTLAALAQAPGQNVSGTVKDMSDAAVPAATIHLLNSQQHSVGAAQSDEQGRFMIENVPPGTYELLVTAAGFASSRSAVQMPLKENGAVDIRLGVES